MRVFLLLGSVKMMLSVMAFAEVDTIYLSQTIKVAKRDCAERTLFRAYENIGVSLVFRILPPKRALMEANMGSTDGETARVKGIDKAFPNLIRIPVALCRVNYFFVLNEGVEATSLKGLVGRRVGISSGNVVMEQLASAAGLDAYKARGVLNLIQMMAHKRLDAVIISSSRLADLRLDDSTKDLVAIPIAGKTNYLYHFLHKRHAQLIPKITAELKRLEATGFIKKAMDEHETLAQEKARLAAESK